MNNINNKNILIMDIKTTLKIGSLDVKMVSTSSTPEAHFYLSARGDTNDADYIYSGEESSCMDELSYMTLCFLNKFGSIHDDLYYHHGGLREKVTGFEWLLKPFKSGLISTYVDNEIPLFSLVNDGGLFQFGYDDDYHETPTAGSIDCIELKYVDCNGISYDVELYLDWTDPKIMERFFILTMKDMISSDKVNRASKEELTKELEYINSIRPEGCKLITKNDLV